MTKVTVNLGSINARGLIDAKYSKPGTALGCPRLTALDHRLKTLYDAITNNSDPRHEAAIRIEKRLNEQFVMEMQNLYELEAALAALVNPDDVIQLDIEAQTTPVDVALRQPISFSGLRLVAQYDKLILLIDFLYKTNQLCVQQAHVVARKMREKAGKPVRRFMTQVSKELAAAELSS